MLLACTPENEDINEVFSYSPDGCSRTYDVQSTYMNANGVSNVVITQMNQLETDLSEAVCCEQSEDSPDDPLIEACTSDDPETVVEFTFNDNGC